MAKKKPTAPTPMPGATQRNSPARTPAHARGPAPLAVWRAAFLAAFRLTGNVSAAAEAAGIERSTAYRAKAADPSFEEEWDEALQVASDALELEARKLATGHYLSYKFDKRGQPLLHPITGEPYAERVMSTPMLTLLLKAERPEKFKEKQEVEHKGEVGMTWNETRTYTNSEGKADGAD